MARAKKHPSLQPIEIIRKIGKAAWEKKGGDIVALDVSGLVYYADYFLIISGTSDIHVNALRHHIEAEMNKVGVRPISLEGQEHNRWVLIDYGVVIVHLFYEPLREVYDLEGLWGDAPRVELGLPESAPSATFDLYRR